jgi:formylglycine-generating enzyme required for sulfatase activity
MASRQEAAGGSYTPNAFGLFDVHGNAGEWCEDANDVVYYARSPVEDPCNRPVGDEPRAVRGGAYSGDAVMARSAARISGDPRGGGSSQGARAARSVRTR